MELTNNEFQKKFTEWEEKARELFPQVIVHTQIFSDRQSHLKPYLETLSNIRCAPYSMSATNVTSLK